MAAALFLLVLCGAFVWVGTRYVRTARRMRSYGVARGRVIASFGPAAEVFRREVDREVIVVPGTVDTREGRFGSGGGYTPKPTYTYVVGSRTYTNDRVGYAYRGLKKTVAEKNLAAIPDEVDVHYDPDNPQEAYLETNGPVLGFALILGGTLGVLVALVLLLS